MERFTLKQLAILSRKWLVGKPAFARLTEEKFEAMYQHMSTTLGLIIVGRHSNREPELNLFVSNGLGFNFSDFKQSFLRTCLMTTQFDPREGMEMVQATEATINILLEKFGTISVEKLGQFEIKQVSVWQFTAGEEISLPVAENQVRQ